MPLEYKVLNISPLSGNTQDIESQLNYYGSKNWTLSTTVPEFDIIIFHRPIEINAKLREQQLKEGEDNDSESSGNAEIVPG